MTHGKYLEKFAESIAKHIKKEAKGKRFHDRDYLIVRLKAEDRGDGKARIQTGSEIFGVGNSKLNNRPTRRSRR